MLTMVPPYSAIPMLPDPGLPGRAPGNAVANRHPKSADPSGVDAQSRAMPPRKTTTKASANATAATQRDGRGARRIPGGANQRERDVARHASPGTRAADHPHPRGEDALAAGSPGPGGSWRK